MNRLSILIFLFALNSLNAQENFDRTARAFLKTKTEQFKISDTDVSTARLSDFHFDEKSKTHFVYLQQTHKGVDIFNAITALAVKKDGQVFNSGVGFLPKLSKKTFRSVDKYSAMDALHITLGHLNVPLPKNKIKFQKNRNNLYSLSLSAIAHNDIFAEKIYYAKEGVLILSWRIEYDSKISDKASSTIIDAGNGSILKEINQTLECFHNQAPTNSKGVQQLSKKSKRPVHIQSKKESTKTITDGAQYLVYPNYVEAPNQGVQELLVEPSDPVASPFGWHDTDGRAGAEYTITRGNNGHAYHDKNGNNNSSDDEPDGGQNLIFNTPHNPSNDITDSQNELADVTQIFYMGNFMHDWSYNLGFNEASGNYQSNNYGKGGSSARSGDPVILQTLDDVDAGIEIGNANFTVTSDGNSGRMQMYKWEARARDLVVSSPETVADEYLTGTALFGPGRVTTEFSGNLVLTDDGNGDASDGCQTTMNTTEMNGNIALIRRGDCFFSTKIFNAQRAGALAAVVCNQNPIGSESGGIVNMSGADNADNVTIPGYFLTKEDCDPIERELQEGNEVEIAFVPTEILNISGGFDNGIIAHEYGHGISSRLTGGASRSSCLNNDEEMGEGWSDFFGLVVTQQEGDIGENPRGIGTYVIGQPVGSRGIRRSPYSINRSVNDQTMNDIRGTGTAPHPVGEIWAGVLWDVYWLFIDQYGYDGTWKNEDAGNHKALSLVMAGLKLQPCSPGFIEGRDAIIEADRMMFDGIHECLLWNAFAARGIGFDAIGGNRQNRDDNVEGFQTLPSCIKTIKISKEAPEASNVDDEIEITVTAINHKEETSTNTVVKNILPENAEFISTGTDFSPMLSNGVLTYNIGDLASQQEVEMKYRIRVGTEKQTQRMLFDDFGPGNGFFSNPTATGANNEWKLSPIVKRLGRNSYNIINDTLEVEGFLQQSIPVVLDQEKPAFRFWHRYFTEYGYDGGIVEISEDGGQTWSYVPDELFLSNSYNVDMIFNHFDTLPANTAPVIKGFTGSSGSWVQSIVDLSSFKGNEVLIRFRWVSDINQGIAGSFSGWFIDYVDYLDLADAIGTTCLTADNQDEICTTSQTVLQVKEGSTPNNDITKSEFNLSVFPNPSNTDMNVRFTLEKKTDVVFTISDLNGRVISRSSNSFNSGTHFENVLSNNLPQGTYILQMNIGGQLYNEKLMKLSE